MNEVSIIAISAAAAIAIYCICATVQDVAMRWLRHKNIAAHGWPPIYLDADGESVDLDITQDGEA